MLQKTEGYTATFTWGANDFIYNNNQLFNVYADGVKVLENVVAGVHSYTFDKAGNHTIRITGVLNGMETTGVTLNVEIAESETTTETPTTAKPEIIENNNVKIEGYQISTTLEGSRVIGSVEPTIEGKNVKSWGLIYAIVQNGNNTYDVSSDDMYVGSTSKYVSAMESTSVGTLSVVMGDSKTATYFARTTLFSAKTTAEFNAKYMVRSYALMDDGTYYYSKTYSYTVFNIAKVLYNSGKMNNYSGHKYLYNNILKVVDSSFKEVDYNWSNTIVK